jgi:glycosyltransferase involved in cell wall biosynthesis
MGRQMHGLGDALAARGHRVDYLFAESLAAGVSPRLSRLVSPVRAAMRLAQNVERGAPAPIAILHEPIGWPAATLLRRRVHTVAMVHACEIKCWRIQLETSRETGQRITPSSRIVWPLTQLTQTWMTLKTAAAVFCLATEDVAYMRDRLHVPADRIVRIDNGIEPPFLGLPLQEGLSERDILFLGSWIPRKGIRVLAAALDKLAAAGVQAKLTLAGTGSTVEEIRSALPPVWRAQTEIIPHVPPDELIQLYQRHWIFLLPAIAEGIPLAMLEAMACGLCPIVSDVGGVSDVVKDGANGTLVPMLDVDALVGAITRALREPAATRALARNAHATMQGYSWDRSAGQVEAFCAARFGAS